MAPGLDGHAMSAICSSDRADELERGDGAEVIALGILVVGTPTRDACSCPLTSSEFGMPRRGASSVQGQADEDKSRVVAKG